MAADPADRIEKALARIEVAGAKRSYDLDRLQLRHTRLRGRIEDAMASLDALIARERVGEED